MPWIWAALMPHPPIIVPEVGRGRETEAAATLAGARTLVERLSALPRRGRPDVLVLLSPHQPYANGALFLNSAPEIKGGLERFGAPEVRFSLRTSQAWPDLVHHLEESGFQLASGEVGNLTPDHGATVPLYYLAQAFEDMPPVILGSPIGLTPAKALALGRALADLDTGEQTWALLASGDLSHRLTREAPAGFNPEGRLFDDDVVAALRSGDAQSLIDRWPPHRLEAAGECGFRSVLVLLGLANGPVEVLSYEGPFGVGYSLALTQG